MELRMKKQRERRPGQAKTLAKGLCFATFGVV